MEHDPPTVVHAHSAVEMVAIGRVLASVMPAGIPIALVGDMGAGKTQFCKGLALGVGVSDADAVTSPTFTIHHPHCGTRTFHHIDLHRITTPSEIPQEVFDALDDPAALTAVEWADRFWHIWPKRLLVVTIAHKSADERVLSFYARGFDGSTLLQEMCAKMAARR